jgi:hypothetical protein
MSGFLGVKEVREVKEVKTIEEFVKLRIECILNDYEENTVFVPVWSGSDSDGRGACGVDCRSVEC